MKVGTNFYLLILNSFNFISWNEENKKVLLLLGCTVPACMHASGVADNFASVSSTHVLQGNAIWMHSNAFRLNFLLLWVWCKHKDKGTSSSEWSAWSLVPRLSLSFSHFLSFLRTNITRKESKDSESLHRTTPTSGQPWPWPWSWWPSTQLCAVSLPCASWQTLPKDHEAYRINRLITSRGTRLPLKMAIEAKLSKYKPKAFTTYYLSDFLESTRQRNNTVHYWAHGWPRVGAGSFRV
jgi:hypothetical protein